VIPLLLSLSQAASETSARRPLVVPGTDRPTLFEGNFALVHRNFLLVNNKRFTGIKLSISADKKERRKLSISPV